MNALPRVCVSVPADACDRGLPALGVPYALEIRLDADPATPDRLARMVAASPWTIATCRPGVRSPEACGEVLVRALAAGARWVDLDRGAPPDVLARVRAEAARLARGLIVSHHDFASTPTRAALEEIVAECFALGADIAKVACLATSRVDVERVLSLYATESRPLVAFCMGDIGRSSRVQALLRGAPFMYCSAAPGLETAPGQIDAAEMLRLLALEEGSP